LTSLSVRDRTIGAMLRERAMRQADAVALVVPHRDPLSYGRLWDHVRGVADWLDGQGIRHPDRVAIVLPNGPEMATALLGVSLAATTAPLNPLCSADEFSYYFAGLGPKAVITERGMNTAMRTVAAARGLPVVELTPLHDDAPGVFGLNGDVLRPTDRTRYGECDDVALVIHTSGTTAHPKRVPLTHDNLCWSANNIAGSLELSEEDRCLNVMPLFNTHGIVAALLASLSSGGSVACAPGFDEARFFELMRELKPTWFTAVPAIHQAVVQHAERARDVIQDVRLRFVRSSSAPLPDRVVDELEALIGVPMLDAYGMTEAGQIASNRLSPSMRRRGSVGIPVGCEVAIMDESGTLLPPGERGEIVVRGRNVTRGYEENAEANAGTFVNGWYRTGDSGTLDGDGFLSLTGRLKDIINRGGEKIAPREIDEILLRHPDVREAVVFPVPHPTLGESIAAAVTGREGRTVSEMAVRHFASAHLPDFKIPDRILVVDTIPKGQTGKVRRTQLADFFASALRVAFEPAADPLEHSCVAAFERILQLDRVGRNDNFFALGGDSICVTQVISRLAEEIGIDLPPTIVFRHPTAASLASELARLVQQEKDLASLADELRKMSPGDAIRMLRNSSGSPDDGGGKA
jgi:oxalate---CoA ligase